MKALNYFIKFIFIFLLGVFNSLGQTYNMPGGTINTCSGTFYDTGGAGGNYLNNQNITQTFCSDIPGEPIVLDFTAFTIENNWDFLSIYNGPTTGSPLIGTFTGTSSPGQVVSSGSCLTVVFTSDGSVVMAGWAATISCGTPPPPPPSINMSNGSSTTCSSMFYDSGGAGGNYGNNQNFTYTICPDTPGSFVVADFTAGPFNVENGWDFLTIYDGNSTAAPSVGTFSGGTAPGLIQASFLNPSGCLTFVFTSDGSVVQSGWVATISCTIPCQIINSVFDSSTPAPDGDGIIRICQGESVTFNGSGTFSESGVGATYSWNFGDGNIGAGTSASNTYNEPGGFAVNLNITDAEGCINNNLINQTVQVSTDPVFVGTTATNPTICLGETNTLVGVVNTTPQEVICTPPVSGTTFLPDGSGVSYSTCITVDCFAAGQTLTSGSEIEDICINMEHSYLGDLSMRIVCPNGTQVTLKAYPGGGGTYLGSPIDGGPGPGTGFDYCFSMSGTTLLVAGPTVMAGVPAWNSIAPGTYLPVGNFNGLVGCPLNGDWCISITDHLSIDDGYIFSWGMDFDPSIVPPDVNFQPVVVTEGWQADLTIVSTVGNTITVEPTVAGISCYTYEMTDNFGCTYDTTVCFIVEPAGDPGLDGVAQFCNTGLEEDLFNYLNGTPETGGQWFNPSGQMITMPILPDTIASGLYEYQIGLGACLSTATINVTVSNLQANAIVTNSACAAMNGIVEINAFDGIEPYQYSNDGGITFQASNIFSGGMGDGNTYSFTIIDDIGCSISIDALVDDESSPQIDNIVTVDSDCGANNGQVSNTTVSSGGTAPYTYSVSGITGFVALPIGNLAPGTYDLIVQDDNGCTGTEQFTIQEINFPTLNAPVVVNVNCNSACNGTITLTGTNLSNYTITNATGVSTNNATGVFNGLCPGNYSITVDNGFGCTVNNNAVITEPTPLQITFLSADATICPGDEITLNVNGTGGNGNYTYNWANGGNNLGQGTSLTFNPSGNMTVCVTMSEDCPSPTVQQCMNIITPSDINPQITSDITNGCYPITVNFSNITASSEIATTQWNFSNGASYTTSSMAPIITTFNQPGLYDLTVTITSIYGCIYTASFLEYIEAYDFPIASFSHGPIPLTIYETNANFYDQSSDDVVQWSWSLGNGAIPTVSNEQNPKATYPEGIPALYPVQLIVWNEYGCSDTANGLVQIVNDVMIYAPNIFTPDGDQNNNDWRIYITGIDIYDFNLLLFNRWGEIVWESNDPNASWNGTYGGIGGIVQDGTYIWVVKAKDSYNDKKYEFRGHVSIMR